jgi:hypothetical protein
MPVAAFGEHWLMIAATSAGVSGSAAYSIQQEGTDNRSATFRLTELLLPPLKLQLRKAMR